MTAKRGLFGRVFKWTFWIHFVFGVFAVVIGLGGEDPLGVIIKLFFAGAVNGCLFGGIVLVVRWLFYADKD